MHLSSSSFLSRFSIFSRTLPLRVERLSRNTSDNKEFHATLVFKEYIQHHLKVYDLATQLENLCYLMILAVLLASVIMLCGMLYQSSRVSKSYIYFNSQRCGKVNCWIELVLSN